MEAQMDNQRFLQSPKFINFEITTACHLRCPQCYSSISSREMDKDLYMGYLKQAAKFNVKHINLTGGEPLLCSYIDYAIEAINKLGMKAGIVTSGFNLNPKRLEELMKVGLKFITVSLNGSTKEIHEKSRRGFYISIKAIEALSKTNIFYAINWVAREDNINDFPALVELAKSYKVKRIAIRRSKPNINGEKACEPDKDKMIKLAEFIKLYNSKDININVYNCYPTLANIIYKDEESVPDCGCIAGRKYMAIDVDGNFLPCRLMNYKEKYDSISDYWLNSRVIGMLRSVEENVQSPCRECAMLPACRTCRALCQSLYGDFYAGEKDCPFFKEEKNNRHKNF